MKFKSLIYISLTLLVACSPKTAPKPVPEVDVLVPTEKDVSAGSHKYPDLQLAQLNQGYTILQTQCTRCHKMYKPGDFAQSDWDMIIPNMAKKARLTDEEKDKLERYIVSKKLNG